MTTIQEMSNDINKDYEFEIIIKRKRDGHGTRLSISALHEVFQTDFLSQMIQAVRREENSDG